MLRRPHRIVAIPKVLAVHDHETGRWDGARILQFGRVLDVLSCADPANMNYLSGYDGWSFYGHQFPRKLFVKP